MNILLLDNYDSFTYNLVHLVEKILHQRVEVVRNDQIALEQIRKYDKIILSPGPGIPSESGILLDLIKTYASEKSILGVCLGEQAIGEVFGGKLINLEQVYHGVATDCFILKREGIFKDFPEKIKVGRYHSWVVSSENFPDALEITAQDAQGMVMGLRHKIDDVQGVQFHPESILTPSGEALLKNWLKQ